MANNHLHSSAQRTDCTPTGPLVRAASIEVRDRIRELRRVRASDLLPNPKNWRRHPQAQIAALRGLLAEIGYADALLARELPDGRLMLIDRHLRADVTPAATVPVLVVDLDEAEADKLLLTLDPLAAMAEADGERIQSLLETVQTSDKAVGRYCGALPATRSGGCCIRRPNPPPKWIRRASCKRNGEQRPVNSGVSASTGCYAATLPKQQTSNA